LSTKHALPATGDEIINLAETGIGESSPFSQLNERSSEVWLFGEEQFTLQLFEVTAISLERCNDVRFSPGVILAAVATSPGVRSYARFSNRFDIVVWSFDADS
jgi:hypothetical protein